MMSINTQELINTFLFDILFKGDLDENSLKLFSSKERKEINQMGADLASEIVLFYDHWNNNSAQGILLNIANDGDFKRYQPDGKNIIKLSNSDYGVLIYIDEHAPPEVTKHYTKIAENIINIENNPRKLKQSKGVVNLSYHGDTSSYLKDLALNVNLKNQTILIDGKGQLNNKTKSTVTKYNVFKNPAKSRYFEIQTTEIPDEAMSYLDTYLDKIGVDIPNISSQQIMIYGITVDNINGSTAFLPKFDWILRFNGPVQIDSILNTLHLDYKSEIDLRNKVIQLGALKYHYKQIAENEIYIGVTEAPSFIITEAQPSQLTRGFPSAIFEIEGKGIIAHFITLLPQVKMTKQFLEDVIYFNIHTTQNEDTLSINGEIRLKDDQLMSVELAKYLMMFIK